MNTSITVKSRLISLSTLTSVGGTSGRERANSETDEAAREATSDSTAIRPSSTFSRSRRIPAMRASSIWVPAVAGRTLKMSSASPVVTAPNGSREKMAASMMSSLLANRTPVILASKPGTSSATTTSSTWLLPRWGMTCSAQGPLPAQQQLDVQGDLGERALGKVAIGQATQHRRHPGVGVASRPSFLTSWRLWRRASLARSAVSRSGPRSR